MNINCPVCNKAMSINTHVAKCDMQLEFIPYFGFEVAYIHAKYFLNGGDEIFSKQIEIPPYLIHIYDDFTDIELRTYSPHKYGYQYITSQKRILTIGYPLDLSNFNSETIIKRIKTLILFS